MKWLLILFIIGSIIGCSHEPKNPRTMNGKTVIRTNDSVYFVTFKIDSVIAMEYEQPDKEH